MTSVREWKISRRDRKKLRRLLYLLLPLPQAAFIGDGEAHKWTPAVGPHCTFVSAGANLPLS